MGSVLQALVHNPLLRDHYLRHKDEDEGAPKPVAQQGGSEDSFGMQVNPTAL
jgi:hypothetical protein